MPDKRLLENVKKLKESAENACQSHLENPITNNSCERANEERLLVIATNSETNQFMLLVSGEP